MGMRGYSLCDGEEDESHTENRTLLLQTHSWPELALQIWNKYRHPHETPPDSRLHFNLDCH